MDEFPENPHIYFSVNKRSALNMNPGTIVICTPSDRWNDFGHQTIFDFALIVGPAEVIWSRLRLAFLKPLNKDESEYDLVNEIFSHRGAVDTLSLDNFPHFFTMQLSAEAYSNLSKELGENTARNILTKLNDVVVAEHSDAQQPWLETALKSSAFNRSFLRTPEGFLAYFEGNAALAGQVSKIDSSLPQKLNFHFQLDGFLNSHEFRFSFDPSSLFPKRMAAIIGKNGVGKSRALNNLVHAVLRRDENITDENGNFPNISKIIAICTPGETESTFPRAEDIHSAIEYVRLSAIPGQKMTSSNETLPLVLQKLARRDIEENNNKLHIFQRSVESILNFEDLWIVPPADSANNGNLVQIVGSVRLHDLSWGNEKSILDSAMKLDRNGVLVHGINGRYFPLSSGQISFIRLAAQLCLHMSPGTLVLIDEPETHLHPRLVTEFVVMLNSILELTNSIAIVATHSAYFVREVPTTQVQVIRKTDDGFVQIGNPRLKTFGSDIGAISDFIFDDEAASRIIRDVGAKIHEDESLQNDWETSHGHEISTEAIMYLKRSLKENGDIEK
ncbi:AAA family ATPase [Undibacterium sp. TC4M20W]|uniref:AAA family ATPase n=1 Tax=Undibacterium sp. TC4M20W TaxID=3413052 RepID=UPI003BF178DE